MIALILWIIQDHWKKKISQWKHWYCLFAYNMGFFLICRLGFDKFSHINVSQLRIKQYLKDNLQENECMNKCILVRNSPAIHIGRIWCDSRIWNTTGSSEWSRDWEEGLELLNDDIVVHVSIFVQGQPPDPGPWQSVSSSPNWLHYSRSCVL